MELQLQISDEVIKKLLILGVLHPNEIKCLNSESRDVIKNMCLASCSPKNCHLCDMRDSCSMPFMDEKRVNISIQNKKVLESVKGF